MKAHTRKKYLGQQHSQPRIYNVLFVEAEEREMEQKKK